VPGAGAVCWLVEPLVVPLPVEPLVELPPLVEPPPPPVVCAETVVVNATAKSAATFFLN